jgi:hypothetical protein
VERIDRYSFEDVSAGSSSNFFIRYNLVTGLKAFSDTGTEKNRKKERKKKNRVSLLNRFKRYSGS